MPRRRRPDIPGLTQHVIQRGNNRTQIFGCTGDYVVFLAILRDACIRHQLDVHAYVLMTTHVHLLVTPRVPRAVSLAMQAIGRRYVYHFNRRYGRTGTLFEGRYRSTLIETESYWFNCMRYVELNPVRAALVSDPEAYPWSSYRRNALGADDRLVMPHWMYESLGDSPHRRQQSWREFCSEPIADRQLAEIRHAVQHGDPLGDVGRLAVQAAGSDPDLTPV